MRATYLDTGDYFEGIAAANLASGDVVFAADGRAGVITAMEGVLNGKRFKAQASGRYRMIALTTGVWAAGALVFWDAANARVTNVAAGNRLVGYAEVAKTNGQTSNIVVLRTIENGVFIPPDALQALSGAGAINVTSYLTRFTSTGGAQALTLANGTRVGHLKKVHHSVDGGSGVLTPTSLSGGTTITFTNVGDYALLMWNGTAWLPVELGNDAAGSGAATLA